MTSATSAAHATTGDGRSHTARHRRALGWSLALTSGFLVVEVVAGLWSGSLALLADAGHMLTDAGGLAMALLATWFATKPPTPEKTYGYYRAEILAALLNAVALLVISVFILCEAYRRFLAPPEVLGKPMLVVAVVGLAVNLAGMWLLRSGSSESLNLQGAYLEVLGDALGSLGVIVAALLLLAFGWRLADPIIGAGIGLFIIPRTWGLLRQAVNVLLEGTPPHVNLAEVERAMRAVRGVRAVHDLHVWTLTSGKYAMSGHVLLDDPAEGTRVLREVHAALREKFAVGHTTIQLETEPLINIGAAGGEGPPGSESR